MKRAYWARHPALLGELEDMRTESKAYLVGGGIGSLAAAAFMIRDGGLPGKNISILEAASILGRKSGWRR